MHVLESLRRIASNAAGVWRMQPAIRAASDSALFGNLFAILAMVALRRGAFLSGQVHLILGAVALLILVNSSLHLYVARDVRQTTNLVMVMIGFSCILYSLPWHIVIVTSSVAAWAIALWAGRTNPELNHYGVLLFSSAILSSFILVMRIRSQVRILNYQNCLEDLVRERTADLKNEVLEHEKVVSDLTRALENVKTLTGLLPICANCKKVRDDSGYWQAVEGFISRRTDVSFSHSICPECLQKYYPEYSGDDA